MKRFSLKPRLEALGKYVRDHPIFPFLPENALFWMFLLLLSIGSAMTLYGEGERGRGKQACKRAAGGRGVLL